MRKFFIILAILLFLPSISTYSSSANNIKTYYAKAKNTGIYFYSSPVEGESYRLFEIPSSYFVLLTGDENEKFYTAKYDDIYGYVLKSSISPMSGSPKKPYIKSSFRVFSQIGLPLYSSPTTSSTYEVTIPFETKITNAYGKALGQEVLSNSTNEWFYCSYTIDKKTYFGYLFSYYCDNSSDIPENTEFFTEITMPLDFSPINTSPTASLSDTAKILIAFGVIIPCMVILSLMLKPKNKVKSPKKRLVIHRPKRDYYEFNEDDLK